MDAQLDFLSGGGRRRHPEAACTVAGRPVARRRAGYHLALAAALTLLLPAVYSQAAAATSSPLPALVRIDMVSATTGWAVTHTRLLRTTDGGKIWHDLTPPGTGGAQIENGSILEYASYGGLPPNLTVVGSAAAWLVVPATNSLSVYGTTDAGAHWRSASLALDAGGNQPGILGVHFVDKHHGWLAVTLGGGAAGSMDEELYASSDGGATWHLASGHFGTRSSFGPTPLSGIKTGFGFADTRHGWLTGSSNYPGVWLYASSNAGRNWHRASLTAPSGSPVAKMLHRSPTTLPPWFIGPRKGYLPVFGSTGKSLLAVFFATSNGGTTWQPTTPIVTKSTWPRFWNWPNARCGFESNGSRLSITLNRGLTWLVRALPKKLKPVTQIHFGSPSVGWAIVHGKLLKTKNRGRSWTSLAASVVSP